MTEVQADRMLAYLDVIALCTTMIAAQGQKRAALTDMEVEQCQADAAESVRQVFSALRPGP